MPTKYSHNPPAPLHLSSNHSKDSYSDQGKQNILLHFIVLKRINKSILPSFQLHDHLLNNVFAHGNQSRNFKGSSASDSCINRYLHPYHKAFKTIFDFSLSSCGLCAHNDAHRPNHVSRWITNSFCFPLKNRIICSYQFCMYLIYGSFLFDSVQIRHRVVWHVGIVHKHVISNQSTSKHMVLSILGCSTWHTFNGCFYRGQRVHSSAKALSRVFLEISAN